MMQRKCNFKNYKNNSNNQCPIWLVIKKGEKKTVFKITQAITLGNGEFPKAWYYNITGCFDKKCS